MLLGDQQYLVNLDLNQVQVTQRRSGGTHYPRLLLGCAGR
jgi:hypothetical protein